MAERATLPPGSLDRIDTGDDLAFYAPPRLVTHIDEVAVEASTATRCPMAAGCST